MTSTRRNENVFVRIPRKFMINFCDESFLLFASCFRLLIDLENRELDQFRWTALVRRPENLLAPSFGVTKFGNAARISLTILFVEVTQCACEGSHFFGNLSVSTILHVLNGTTVIFFNGGRSEKAAECKTIWSLRRMLGNALVGTLPTLIRCLTGIFDLLPGTQYLRFTWQVLEY